MAKKTSRGKVAAEIATGLAVAGAAAAAGYYFYGSKKAKAHRKIAAAWANDLKKEVIREAKRLRNATPKDFAKVVDTVAKTYLDARSVNAADVKRAAHELKSNWEMVQREARKTGRAGVSRAKAAGTRSLARGKRAVKNVLKKTKRTSR